MSDEYPSKSLRSTSPMSVGSVISPPNFCLIQSAAASVFPAGGSRRNAGGGRRSVSQSQGNGTSWSDPLLSLSLSLSLSPRSRKDARDRQPAVKGARARARENARPR